MRLDHYTLINILASILNVHPDDQIVLAHTNSMIILSLLAENDLSLSGNQTSINCLHDKMLMFIKNKNA